MEKHNNMQLQGMVLRRKAPRATESNLLLKFKKGSAKALAQGRASLLFEDAVRRAEKKAARSRVLGSARERSESESRREIGTSSLYYVPSMHAEVTGKQWDIPETTLPTWRDPAADCSHSPCHRYTLN